MNDPRIVQLAKTLVQYSIGVKPRQTVEVIGHSEAEPLFVALYEQLIRAGAFPELRMTPERTQEIFFQQGQPHHFDTLTPYRRATIRTTDATIRILATANSRSLSNVDPQRQAAFTKAMRPWKEALLNKPWTLTLFPTPAFAQDAEMCLADFEDFVYHATFSDDPDPVARWRELEAYQNTLTVALKGSDRVRIVAPDTDLTLSVKGRPFINSTGTHNMPSGEIFTSPIEHSAEGHIRFDFPVCHGGREIEGVRLVFKKGTVVEASAEKNEAFLLSMLDMDRGARRLGELGIGTNRNIQRFTKNILFDEKIGGTIHLALGSGFPEAGGRNRSALHWDMIKDLRRGGAVYVDKKVFLQDGAFHLSDSSALPSP